MASQSQLSDPLATPADLADLIAHQPGSIVSRTLLKSPAGSLTLFAFDAGQGLSEHTTPHEAVVLILDGRAEVIVGEKSVSAGPGQALNLPAGVPHALHAPERFKMLLVMFRRTVE
jgi:quercetin dioxygenase-like cupin family protein